MMTGSLGGHTAIVTGGGSGIGRATVITLAGAGATVAATDIDGDAVDRVADEVSERGGTAIGIPADVTDRASVTALGATVTDRLGTADIIVNCAGWGVVAPFLDTTPETWERLVAVNYLGTVNVCHEFAGALVQAGQAGRIVNIASDAGRVGSSHEAVYAGAKAGVIAFSKSLARELARYGIGVNCVAPGPTDSPMFYNQSEKGQEALIRAIPLRRLAQPEEIATAVHYLASPAAEYITGQVLSVSGGLTMAD